MIAPASWFDPNALVWIGPLGGLLEGVWGLAIGILARALTRKGRGRGWVYGHHYVGLAAGLLLTGAAVLGAVRGQPRPIWATFAALGVPLLVVAAGSLVAFRDAYRLAELRRMQALEL